MKEMIRKIILWAYPDLKKVLEISEEVMNKYLRLQKEFNVSDKEIKINGPLGLFGNLNNCKIEVEPKINTRLILSEYKLESLLKVMGSNQMINSNLFQGFDEKSNEIEMGKKDNGI